MEFGDEELPDLTAAAIKPKKRGPVTRQDIDDLFKNPNANEIYAFFDTIRDAEGGQPDIIVGGASRFDPNSDHPNKVGLVTDKGPSTAAGNYQITGSNWYGTNDRPGLKKRLGATNFNEQNQLYAAAMLFGDREGGAGFEALKKGDWETAKRIAALDWTSVPGSTIGGGKQRKPEWWNEKFEKNKQKRVYGIELPDLSKVRAETLPDLSSAAVVPVQPKQVSPLVSSATTEVIAQPADAQLVNTPTDVLPDLSSAAVNPVENQQKLLNDYRKYTSDSKNPFLSFEDWRAKFAPKPQTIQSDGLQNLKPNSALSPEEQADLEGLTKQRIVAQQNWNQNPQDFETQKVLNNQYSVWLKEQNRPDDAQARTEFNELLKTAPDFVRTLVNPTIDDLNPQAVRQPPTVRNNRTVQQPQTVQQTQPTPTQNVSGDEETRLFPIKSKEFAPLTLDWNKKRADQTYIGFLKQEAIRRLVQEGVDYESAEKAVNDTVWSTNGQTAATESEYIELAKKNQLGRVVLSSDLYERAQKNRLDRLDKENRKLKVKDRVNAGEDPFDALFQEGFISPEQATTLRYEQKLEDEREAEARRKFEAERNNEQAIFEATQGYLSPDVVREYNQKRTQRSMDELVEQYGSIQNYYKEKERIEKEYEYRVMARPTEFALNIGRYLISTPAKIGKGISILGSEFNPLASETDATKSPFYQFWDGWDKRIQASKNKDFKDDFIVTDLADGLGQLAAQTLLMPVLGFGAIALPMIEAGVGQYEEASKSGAGRFDRGLATVVGGLAAVPDALLKATYLRNFTKGQFRVFLDKVADRLFGSLSKQMSEEAARRSTAQFLTAFVTNAARGGAVEYAQEYSEDVINGTVAKLRYKPQSTWEDVFIPTDRRMRGYLAAGIVGAFGGNINLAMQTMATSELERTDEVLANLLKQNLIDQEQASIVARAVAEEIRRRNVQTNPTAELSKSAVDNFIDKKIAEAAETPKKIAFNKQYGVVEILEEEGEQSLIRITEGAQKGESVVVPNSELVKDTPDAPRAVGLAFDSSPADSNTTKTDELENNDTVSAVNPPIPEKFIEQSEQTPVPDAEKTKRLPRQVIGQTVEIEGVGQGRIADIRDGQFIVDFNPKTNKSGETVYQSRKFFAPKDLSIGGVSLTEYKPPKPKKEPIRTQFTAEDFAAKPAGRALSEDEQSSSDVLKKIRSGIAQTGGGGKILKFTPRTQEKRQKVFTPQNEEFFVSARVIDDSDILTSFDEGYPEILQPRNRNSLASDAQVMAIAQKLIPEKLDDNPNTNDGRPIVVPVEVGGKTKYALITGNGRMMAVRLAREQYPESYQKYASFAASKDEQNNSPNPVYVGILDNSNLDDGDLRSLAVDSNKSQQSAMSPIEQARVDAEALDDSIMKRFAMTDDGDIDTPMNRGFITEFFSRNVTDNERGSLIDTQGRLTADGVNRIKRAIIAKAFGQTSVGMDVLSKIIESPDDAVKNITTALTRTAPRFADLKTAIESDQAFSELDITEEMAIAFNQFAELRKSGTDVKTFVNQQTLPGAESLTDLEKNLLELFNHYSKAARQLTVVLNNYLDGAAAAGNPNQTNLFGEEAISPDPFDLTVAAVEVFEEENGVSDERKLKFTEFGQITTRRKKTESVEKTDPVETQRAEESTERTATDQKTQSEMVEESGRLPAGSVSIELELESISQQNRGIEEKAIDTFPKSRKDFEEKAIEPFKIGDRVIASKIVYGTVVDVVVEKMGKYKGETAYKIKKDSNGDILTYRASEVEPMDAPTESSTESKEKTELSDVSMMSIYDDNGIGYKTNIIQTEQKNFAEQIDQLAANNLDRFEMPEIMSAATPLLERMGLIPAEIKIPTSIVKKAVVKHRIPLSTIKQVTSALNDPVMVFGSAEFENRIVVLTDLFNADNKPVFVVIDSQGTHAHSNINVVPSLQIRERARFVFDSAERLKFWNKQKSQKWLQRVGLRMSELEAVLPTSSILLTEDDFVKKPEFLNDENSMMSIVGNSTVRANVSDIGFFSAVEQAILDKMPNKASAAQIKGLLNPQKTAGIKQEELDWLGLDEFLASKDSFTKQELLDFVRANNVEVEEVVKEQQHINKNEFYFNTYEIDQDTSDENDEGEYVDGKTYKFSWTADGKNFEEAGEIFVADDDSIIKAYGQDYDIETFDDLEDAEEFLENKARYKFDDLEPPDTTKFSQYQLEGEKENYRELLLTMPLRPMSFDEFQKQSWNQGMSEKEAREMYDSIPASELIAKKAQEPYRSSHFDESNILAHVRFNERTDTDSNRTLFVEEIQSDFGQDIRKGKTDLPFPFKKSWQEFAFKRVLRYAVENGFDSVSWTTGEQQNERYDLSKQIASFTYEKNADGTYNLQAEKDGQVIQDGKMQNVKENNLEDIIGKDLANKIINSGKNSGTFTGDNLKIEGQGMKGFYDRIIPSFVQKYVKKWGGKVGSATFAVEFKKLYGKGWFSPDENVVIIESVRNSNFSVYDRTAPVAKLLATVKTFDDAKSFATKFINDIGRRTVHSLTITDAMRESVMQGQPLFSIEENARRSAVRLLKNIPVMDLVPTVEVSRQGDRIKLNLPAMEFLRRTFEQVEINRGQRNFGDDNLAPSFLGLFSDENKLNSAIGVLQEFAKNAKEKGWNEESAAAADFADNIKSALKIGNGTAVFYVVDGKLPQELFHQASFLSASEKALTKRHADPKRLDNHRAMEIADREFFSKQKEYSLKNLQKTRKLSAKAAAELRKAILREELAAWIAEGDPETLKELGLENQEDLADDFLLDWFESYSDKIYNDAQKEGKTPDEAKKEVADRLKRFEEIDYAKEFVQRIIESNRSAESGTEISTREDRQGNAGSSESSDTRGTSQQNQGITPTGSIFEREPAVRRNLDGDMGRGEKRSASLPATQRAAGIGADDVLYTVFGDRAAQREAEKLINENGIDGTIKILQNLTVPDAHHAIASFAIQRMLFDEADRISDTNPKEAENLRQEALQLGAAEALKMVKAGRYIRAAGIVQKTVPGVLFTAQKVYQDKFGAGALLPDALREKIEQKARVAESELAQVESLEKQIKALKNENNSLKKSLSGEEGFRRASKNTLANRKKLVTQIKNRHQSEFDKAMERLRDRIQTKVQESAEIEDVTVMSVYDENVLPAELLNDYATVGAMVLTDGLSAQTMMTPAGFDTAMIAQFGESITPHLQVIHQESLRLRNEWLAELNKEKKVKSVIKEFGENLSDAEIEAILEERTDEIKRRSLIRQMHTLRAERGTSAQTVKRLTALEEIIAKEAKTDTEAVAASILAKRKPSAQEFYREFEALGIENDGSTDSKIQKIYNKILPTAIKSIADAHNALRAGEELLEKAKRLLAKQEADQKRELSSALAENEQELKELENLRLEARERARQSQNEIGKELKRISTGEIKYYAGLALETLNTPRAMMSSLDASFIARQGGWFLLSRPRQQKEAFVSMVGALKNSLDDKGFVQVMNEMEKNPYFELAKKSGVDFAALGQHGDFSITKGEEEFRNNLFGMLSDATKDSKFHSINPARLPNFIIRKSDETYTAFLDAQRLAAFAASAEYFNSIGLTPETHPREYKALAEYINDATGRSTVGNAKMTRILMELPLFSPRFTVSRFKLLYKSTVGLPFLPPATRKVVLKDASLFYGATAAVLGLAYLAGLGVSLDWDDDDFLKVKIGQNRYDLFVGMQQPARALLRLIQSASREFIGQDKSGGFIRDNAPDEMKYDFLNVPRGVPARFLRSKLSPLPSLAVDRILGQDFAGNEFTWTNAILTRLAPIGVTDVGKATYNNGPLGFIGAFPTLLGVGYANYKDRPEEPVTPAEKLATKINSMRFESKADSEEERNLDILKKEIRARARRGENVIDEINKLYHSYQITSREAAELINGMDDSFLESKIKKTPTEYLQEIKKVANEGERKLIDEIIQHRQEKKQNENVNKPRKLLNFTPKKESYRKNN